MFLSLEFADTHWHCTIMNHMIGLFEATTSGMTVHNVKPKGSKDIYQAL